jgi:hypothetical protein
MFSGACAACGASVVSNRQAISHTNRLPDGVIDAGGTDQQFFVQSGFLDFAKEVPRLVDASLDIVRYAPALR